MATKCRVIYNKDRKGKDTRTIKAVKTKDNKDSILFSQLKGFLNPSSFDPDQTALKLYGHTMTDEFKAWFGDWENDKENSSKVVDENGEPRVAFKLTTFANSENKTNGKDSLQVFKTYESALEEGNKYVEESGKGSFQISPVFVNIKNPKIGGNIKDGVDFVFEQNPELQSIGDKQLYSKYLDTIFPDSKVKDIVYHGSLSKFQNFIKNVSKRTTSSDGIWFTSSKELAKEYSVSEKIVHIGIEYEVLKKLKKENLSKNYKITSGFDADNYNEIIKKYGDEQVNNGVIVEIESLGIVYPVIINSQNLKIIDGEGFNQFARDREIEIAKSENKDAVVITNTVDTISNNYDLKSNTYTVFEPEQIHILGSQQDIEGFKRFVETNKLSDTIQERNDGIITFDYYQVESPHSIKNIFNKDFQLNPDIKNENAVNFKLKAVDILLSEKAQFVFEKGKKAGWSLDKILTELQIPKEQKQLILDLNKSNREDIIIDLMSKYGFGVEINVTRIKQTDNYIKALGSKVSSLTQEYGKYYYTDERDIKYQIDKDSWEEASKEYNSINKLERPTQYYSNLTVPGGTNYIEIEISTPLITPSIKGHAQFATNNGIGWFRSDEQNKLNTTRVTLSNKFAHIYNINYNGQIIGTIELPTDLESDSIAIGDVNIEPEFRGKGLGVETYKAAIQMFDKPLESYMATDEANRVWNSLIKQGLAKKTEIGFISIKNNKKLDSKTRRILELQSDLFQNSRDTEDLINKTDKNKLIEFLKNEEKYLQQLNNELEEIKKLKEDDLIEGKLADIKQQENIVRINKQNIDNFERFKKLPDNQFLQLLNKDNNWVKFFIQSIIQDSAKKGYEKVLFPSGNTASKIEGHSTLEEFKKEKEDRIKELESSKKTKEIWTIENFEEVEKHTFGSEKEANEWRNSQDFPDEWYKPYKDERQQKSIEQIDVEIKQLKQELERVETEGFGALKPIYNFYENTVTNILNKTYGKENVKQITDEYGNTWNKIEINIEEDLNPILLSKDESEASLLTYLENILELRDENGQRRTYSIKEANKIAEYLKPLISSEYPSISVNVTEKGNESYIRLYERNSNAVSRTKQFLNEYFPKDEMTPQEITERMSSDWKDLMQELLKYKVDSITMFGTGSSKDFDNKQAAGFYNTGTKQITIVKDSNLITKNSLENAKRSVESVLVHEYIHAITADYIANSKDVMLQSFFERAVDKIKKSVAYNNADDRTKEYVDYHTANLDEFVTGVFTNLKFINILKQIEPIRSPKDFKHLFHEFVKLLERIFKISNNNVTLFEDALDMSIDVITKSSSFNEKGISLDKLSQRIIYRNTTDERNVNVEAFRTLGAVLFDFETNEKNINYTTAQKKIIEKLRKDTELFEENGKELGTSKISISKEILPEMEKITNPKLRKEAIEYWKTLAIKSDEVDRYLMKMPDGSTSYALRRVSDAQSVNFIKFLKSRGSTDEEIAAMENDKDSVVSREMGTKLHGVMEVFMKELALVKPAVKIDPETGVVQSLDSFMEEAVNIFIDSQSDAVKEVVATAEKGDTLDPNITRDMYVYRTKDIEQLARLAIRTYYEIYNTQMDINSQVEDVDKGDFAIFTELKSWDDEDKKAGTQDLVVVYSDGRVGIFDYKFVQMKMYYDEDFQMPTQEEQTELRESQGLAVNEDPEKSEYKGAYVYFNSAKDGLKSAKISSYTKQLTSYSELQLKKYGAKGILQNRIIPINIQYYKDIVKDASGRIIQSSLKPFVKFLDIASEPVKTVPLKEEKAVDPALNKLIERLSIEIAKQDEILMTNGHEDYETAVLIKKLNQSIKDLLGYKDATFLIKILKDLYKEIESKLNGDYYTKANKPTEGVDAVDTELIQSGENITEDSDKQSMDLNDTMKYYDLLKTFEMVAVSLDSIRNYIQQQKGVNSKEYSDFAKNIQEISSKNLLLLEKIKIKQNELLLAEFKNRGVYVDERNFELGILEYKDINYIQTMLGKMSDSKVPHVHLIKQIIDNDFNHNERERMRMSAEEMEKKLEAYTKWANNRGLKGVNIFDPLIVTVNKNGQPDYHLIRQYDYNNWDLKIQSSQKVKDTAWFIENCDFDLEAYNKLMKKAKLRMTNQGLSKEDIDLELSKLREKYDVSANNGSNEAWFTKNIKYYIKPKASKMDVFVSSAFKSLMSPENAPAIEFLNHLYSMNDEISKMLGTQGSKIYSTFIPNVHKSDYEGLNLKDFKSLNFFKNIISRSLVKMDNDNIFGRSRQDDSVSNQLIDDYGRRMQIPLLYLDDLASGINSKSRDLSSSFLLMYQQALSYETAKRTENLLLAVRQALSSSKLLTTDNMGRAHVVDDKYITETLGKNTNLLKQVDTILKREVYGINSLDKDIVLDTKYGKLSAVKLAKNVIGYTGALTLSLNYLSAFGGYFSARMQLQAEANKKIHFDKFSFANAKAAFERFDIKQTLAEMLFDIAQDDRIMERTHSLSSVALNSKLAKLAGGSPLMILQRITDNRLDHDVLSAMMRYYGFGLNGEVLPLHELKERYKDTEYDTSSFMSIYDAMTYKEDLKKEDLKGKQYGIGYHKNTNPFEIVQFKNVLGEQISQEDIDKYFVKFRNKVRAVLSSARGNQHADDKAGYQMYVFGQAVMQYRGWIPAMFQERFARGRYSNETEQIEVGRYRVAFGEIFTQGLAPGVKRFTELLTEVSSFGAIKAFSKDAGTSKFYYEKWKAENPGEYKQFLDSSNNNEAVAFEKYKNSRIAQMRATAAELRIYFGVLAILLAIGFLGGSGGADDDEEYLLVKRTIEVLERARQESGYFMDPNQMSQLITRGPVPSLSIIPTAFNWVQNTIGETLDLAFAPSNKTVNYFPKPGDKPFTVDWLDEKPDNSYRLKFTTKLFPAVGNTLKFFGLNEKTDEPTIFSWLMGLDKADVVK